MAPPVERFVRGLARPGAAPQVHAWVRVRMVGVAAIMTALLAAVAYRAYGLQIRQADRYRELARRQQIAMVEVPAPRGAIYDATGAELAATADIDSVYANPQEVHDLGGTAEKLGRLLDLLPAEVEARLSSPREFVWMERHVRPEEARAVRAARLEGVHLTPEPRRFYPGRNLAGPVLGFAGIDGRGLDGIELTMNEELSGRRVSAAALRDASGTLVTDGPVVPEPGASVKLTIDRFVQYTAERVLAAAIEKNRARAGVVVVLDVPTGGVLAMANWPTYDPNRPVGARDRAARNRAVTDVYEIGSVMKVFSVAAALEAGVVTPDTAFDVNGGKIKIGRKSITDTYRDQVLTVGGILKRSSNVGAVKIAQRLGRGPLRDAMVRFGFGARSGIELPGEERGLLRGAKSWGAIELATISFGMGMSTTPLQVAAGFAAIARGGVYRAPRIVREVREASGRVLERPPPLERRVISEATAAQLVPMMASVFERGKHSGTAGSLQLPGFQAAGKTGTAHKIDPATGQYAKRLYLSSFAGFAPLDRPRVVVLVLIDEPHGDEHYGGLVAGPPWLEVMADTLRYLGVSAGHVPSQAGEAQAGAAPTNGSAPSGGAGSESGPGAGSGTGAGPGPGAGPGSGTGAGSDAVPAAGPGSGTGAGSDAVPAAGPGSGTGAGSDAVSGAGPGSESGSATDTGSDPASDSDAEGERAGEGAPPQGDEAGPAVDMPDLTGVGLADALELAGARCASVQVNGNGQVIEQFPPPGRRRRPAECRIVLSHETGPRPRSPVRGSMTLEQDEPR
jgi:cell division protein FtsI (penicillin-binding protein 3)